jgi:hypothetical protein
VAGGEWYLASHPDEQIVHAALARQRGDDAVEPARDDVLAFVDAARTRIGQPSR